MKKIAGIVLALLTCLSLALTAWAGPVEAEDTQEKTPILAVDTTAADTVTLSIRKMKLEGDIRHEDPEQDFQLVLDAAELTGALIMPEQVDSPEADPPEPVEIRVILQDGAAWNVTGESHLTRLDVGSDCIVNGVVLVDGTIQAQVAGTVFEGNILIQPAATEQETEVLVKPEEETQPDEETQTEEETQPDEETQTEEETVHEHNWQRDGGSPGTCNKDGCYGWSCFECGAYYTEPIPGSALGHDWQMVDQMPATCTDYGYKVFECSRCGEMYIDTEYDAPPLGHDYSIIYPTPGEESLSHTVVCSQCGDSFTAPHWSDGGEYCPSCGFYGAYGFLQPLRLLLKNQ